MGVTRQKKRALYARASLFGIADRLVEGDCEKPIFSVTGVELVAEAGS